MKRHAKAPTAGSTKRLGSKSKLALLACALVACVATLALVVGSASGSTTRFLQEAFGSSNQPTFPADRGMAYDQGANHLYVIDSTADTLQRFNANGTAANFGALGSNAIDGEGTGDETAHGHLAFESNRQREQVALDESGEATDGNVYVTQSAKDVVDIFNSEGEYLGALSESTEGGAFGEPCGVAVNNEGTVYVGDRGDDRIHVFDPAGAVPVNADSAATSFATLVDPCTLAAGMGATDGFLFVARSTAATLSKLDAASGALKYEIATGASTVSVDPTTGHVFVARNTGSSSQVDEYDASGATEATLVSSFKPGSTAEGVAPNGAAEQVYVSRSGTENVEVYGATKIIPDVVTEEPSSNTGVRATLAGTVNPDGVELDECFFEWGPRAEPVVYPNIAPCAETPAEIGTGTSPVAVHADLDGLQPDASYLYRLVAVNPNATITGSNQNFSTANTVTTEAASGIAASEATLNGTVNPDGTALTECAFEWGTTTFYTDSAPCVPAPAGIGSGTSPVAIEADLADLQPGTVYHFRLTAANANGPIYGDDLSFQPPGPAASAWTEDVRFSDATLKAAIDPEGSATTYRFEWGKTPAYGNASPDSPVGSDSSVHELTQQLTELDPDTTYHYRVIATSGVAENVGPDLTFTTYARFAAKTDCPNEANRYGAGAGLPNCRAYEMVSPVDKNGGQIITLTETTGSNQRSTELNQASVGGDKYTYASFKPFANASVDAGYYSTQYMATRQSGGWSTESISPPRSVRAYIPPDHLDAFTPFKAFSPDLSQGILAVRSRFPLTPDAFEKVPNVYTRDGETGALTALTNGIEPVGGESEAPPTVGGRSKDGEHVVFAYAAALTPDAPSNGNRSLYDFSGGELRLVSVLPNGEPDPGSSLLGGGGYGSHAGETGSYDNAISDDGSRIFWSTGVNQHAGGGPTYVRVDGTTTIPVSESSRAVFWAATADGSRALYEVDPLPGVEADLYEFDVDTETRVRIARRVVGVLGASDDFSHIYFVSTDDMAPGGVEGKRNLYLRHGGAVTHVATLADEDVGQGESDESGSSNSYTPNVVGTHPVDRRNRITADGSHIAFMSSRNLTGYDNTDAEGADPPPGLISPTGDADFEVFVYTADTDELICASCKPSGARPVGSALEVPFTTTGDTNFFLGLGGKNGEFWTAAWFPSWENSLHASRVLSEDGNRVFFNSYDALVPQDTNGLQDVYQWERHGSGGCDRAAGCISLISTGRSGEKSEFLEATPSGDDVFIRTASSIAPGDTYGYDVYDARVGGGYPPPPPPPIPCLGDSCQSPPPPPKFQSLASAGFRGAGDPKPARRRCGGLGKRAARLSRQAKRLQRAARRSGSSSRSRRLRRRATRAARRARGLSGQAKRCRRANRRAKR